MEPQSKMMSHSNIVLLSERGKEKKPNFHALLTRRNQKAAGSGNARRPRSFTYTDSTFPKRAWSLVKRGDGLSRLPGTTLWEQGTPAYLAS